MKAKQASSLKKQTEEQDPKKVDFTKKYNNGHKFFNSTETQAYNDILKKEEYISKKFDTIKSKLILPRNPLCGDLTPRDEKGDYVINPNAHGKAVGGTLIFPNGLSRTSTLSSEALKRMTKKDLVAKIGEEQGRYDILGNTFSSTLNKSNELYGTVGNNYEKKFEEQKEKELLRDFILNEKAKRHEKDIERQIRNLRQQQIEKEQELNYLKATFKLHN